MAQREEVRRLPGAGSPNRIPPHNLDAEQSVLGAMMESKAAISNVVEILRDEDFYKPAHVEIFLAIVALDQRSQAVDAITVAEELSRRGMLEDIGGKPYLHGLLEAYPTASAATKYAQIVEEHARLRRLVGAGNEIQEIGFSLPEDVDQAVDQAEEIIYNVADRRLRDSVKHLRGLLSENMEALEKLADRGESVTGVSTGFPDLDDYTSGFQPSNFIVVAARPGMGKCLAEDSLVCDPSTGEQLTIRRFVEEKRSSILSLNSEGSLKPAAVTDWIDNGVRPCFKLTTRLGRTIEATDNHPFLTVDGWTPLADLDVGRKIAIAADMPVEGEESDGHLPQEVWTQVRKAAEGAGLSLSELSRRAGEFTSNVHTNRGLPRARLARYAEILDSDDLRWLASTDLYWDQIIAIKPVGTRRVFDLTIPESHNFVAEGIVVHNSSLLNDFALSCALKTRKPVMMFNLEMSRHELTRRFLASEAKVDSQRMNKGTLQERDWIQLSSALGRLAEAPIYIDDSANITLMEIRAKCRRLKAREGLGMVIIDYLQLMQSPRRSENRQQEVSDLSRNLKILARELEVPVICAAQLNRAVEYRADKRPLLGDLRESGSIEQDSDVVMFIYRDELYNPDSEHRGEAELIIAKHRNGPTGTIRLAFMNQFTKFASMARVPGGR